MTEERRAEPVVDGVAKPAAAAAGGAEEQLEDAELEEAPVAKVPPVMRKTLASQPPDAPSVTAPGTTSSRLRDSSPGHAKRSRRGMTLRIPDDEISRPQPAVAPASVQPSSTASSPPVLARSDAAALPSATLQPMRIISIEAPTPPPAEAEDSWTPYKSAVADDVVDGASADRVTSGTHAVSDRALTDAPTERHLGATPSEDLIPITSESEPEPPSVPPDSAEPLELDDAESQAVLSSRPPPAQTPPPPPPASALAAPLIPAIPRAPTVPDVAVARAASASTSTSSPPPARAVAPTEPEGEEVKFEDDEPTPIAPPVDRQSEPGDAAEISAEDMVSVESVPSPAIAKAHQPTSAVGKTHTPLQVPLTPPLGYIPPMRPRVASVPPPVPVPVPLPTPRPPLVIVPPHSGVAPQSSDASARRKARPWWEDLFNDDYIRTMAKITDAQIAKEADYIEDSLGVAKGGTMLDLACGTGAHAIELARRGYEVVGFDLSLAMLARAADDAQESKQKLNFVQGDMREMTFEDAFDGVYCWNTSFGFFDEETNAKVVGKVHKALKKGGQFVLDVGNRDFIAKQAPSLAWFEGDGCVCMDEMQIDWITSRMRVKRTLMMDDGRSKEIEYSVRLYALHELGRILHEQGFRVAEVSGRTATPGVFFGAESPRTLILAEKR